MSIMSMMNGVNPASGRFSDGVSGLKIVIFQAHDILTDLLVRYMVWVKRGVLIIAHLSIFGLFFPGLRSEFGSAAFAVLVFLLFLSPMARILRMRLLLILMAYRRQMGILMGYLALVHGIGYFIDPVWLNTFIFPFVSSGLWHVDPRFSSGIVAVVLTLPLLFTSNDLSTRLLGRNWKRLHWLVYPVFVLVTLHQSIVGQGFSVETVGSALLLIAAYLLLKFWASRGLPESLEKLRAVVASEYVRYREQSTQLGQ